jgi:hypothetical protein
MAEACPVRRRVRRDRGRRRRVLVGRLGDGRTARQLAADQSRTDVVSALSLICVDQSKRDPQLVERVAALKAASSWTRSDLVMKNGWATMPGTTEGNRQVASACADKVGV